MDSEIRNDAEHASILADEPFSAAPVAVGFERRVRRAAWWSAAKVASLYALCGIVWIVLSDRVLGRLGATVSADLLQFGTLKGLAFVLVTATVLLLGLHRALLRWHRFEIKARASAELMRTVAATLPDALVVLDADGRIRYANTHARTVLGVTRSALIGNAYDAPEWTITDADGAAMESSRLPFAQVRAEMKPVMGAVHAINPVGEARKVLSINAAPLVSADGEFAGMVASIRDITQARREQIINERSRGVLRALSDFDAFVLGNRARRMKSSNMRAAA